ncbi:MAG: hypothetical protein JSW33_01300 [bacterium]|nr:MAG: hypothetical protein JSW33_01300 [bacterium]
MRNLLFYFFIWVFPILAQTGTADSLKIQYAIVGIYFDEDHDIIKIKVPPWLKTSDLMSQIRMAVIWPGEPAPKKTTYIYVFKETDQVGDVSQTGAVYTPGKGFKWCLTSWQPTPEPSGIPTEKDFEIYYVLIDRILQQGATLGDQELRSEVAGEFSLTLSELDSIYTFVKYWLVEKELK